MELLIENLKKINTGKLLQTNPLCFEYQNVEYEFSIADKEQSTYIISCILYENDNMTYEEVVQYMAAYLASDGDYGMVLQYVLDKNEDDTYQFGIYQEKTFYFSELIKNPSDYLWCHILVKMQEMNNNFFYEVNKMQNR